MYTFYIHCLSLLTSQTVFYNFCLTCDMLFSQIASFLLYLSDVEEGGETMFPFEVELLLKSSLLCFSFFFFKNFKFCVLMHLNI